MFFLLMSASILEIKEYFFVNISLECTIQGLANKSLVNMSFQLQVPDHLHKIETGNCFKIIKHTPTFTKS